VCCTAACDGGCRRCAPSGITCENLADDAACGDIQCPLDTTCRDYPASVDTERCVAGRCGSGEQLCIDVPRAVGQVCSANNLCDDAGNCSAPKKDPGAMCGSAGECASNFCVDGVCCNEPCNGVCETCAITGLCRGTPTDTSCPALDCNQYADACVLSNGAGRLCTGRRQCMNDCGFRAAGNDCGDGVCDGQGACVPGVSCPFADCPTVVSTCCSQITDIDTFQIQLSCLPASQLVGGACPIPDLIPSIPMRCDEHSDCPGNEVCCYSVNNVASELSCRAPSACLPDPTDFQTVRQQLCRSPKGNFACPAQAPFCAAGTDRVPGYNFCREVQ
jgi:hypothetical protein